MDKFVDSGFIHHLAIGRLWAGHTLLLAESEIIPYDLVMFTQQMQRYFDLFESYYNATLTKQNITLGKIVKLFASDEGNLYCM